MVEVYSSGVNGNVWQFAPPPAYAACFTHIFRWMQYSLVITLFMPDAGTAFALISRGDAGLLFDSIQKY